MAALSAPDRIRIAAKAIASPRTVARVYAGGGNEYSRERIRVAAQELGLPTPQLTRGADNKAA